MKKTYILTWLLLCLSLPVYAIYDPSTGRWLNRDPLGENGGLNLYAYCENDPVNRIDPLGLEDLMFYRPTDDIFRSAQAFNPKGFYSMGAHGNEDGKTFIDDRSRASWWKSIFQDQTASTLQQAIKKEGSWKKGTPIVGTVCHGGKGGANSLLGQLSKSMNTKVYGTPEMVWLYGGFDGKPLKVFVAPRNPANPKQPDMSRIMPWVEFSPDETSREVKNPFNYDP